VPDVRHIAMDVHIKRFDQDLYKLDTNHIQAGLQQLNAAYPAFLPAYIEHIMNFGPYSDSSQLVQLQTRRLVGNADFRVLQDTINAQFPNLDGLEKDLAQSFRYIKYYFPEFKAPQIVAFSSVISNYGAVTIDSVLGIGLDMYLGKDFPVYALLPDYPAYMIRKFSKEYITANSIQVLSLQMYPAAEPSEQLVAQLVSAGKHQYFLEQVLPDVADSVRLGYSKDQMEWCNENEQMVWQFFIQQNLLYKADWQSNMHFINDGPSTQGMPEGSPGRIGSFVGWQIVKQYMKQHPAVTLKQLMDTKDAMQIFSQSKYRPK
jgi:cell shape-determining protein MreD